MLISTALSFLNASSTVFTLDSIKFSEIKRISWYGGVQHLYILEKKKRPRCRKPRRALHYVGDGVNGGLSLRRSSGAMRELTSLLPVRPSELPQPQASVLSLSHRL